MLPGEIKSYKDDMHPEGYRVQEYHHDFFNYAGIHRPVRIYTTPKTYIDDITVNTDVIGKKGIVTYNILTQGETTDIKVSLIDEEGKVVAKSNGFSGKLEVENAILWGPGKPYLYTLKAEIINKDGSIADCYRLPVGIRTIKVIEKEFLINGKPFYFKGFGKHEDMDIKGKGLDESILLKDFNLLEWIGANSVRTSGKQDDPIKFLFRKFIKSFFKLNLLKHFKITVLIFKFEHFAKLAIITGYIFIN